MLILIFNKKYLLLNRSIASFTSNIDFSNTSNGLIFLRRSGAVVHRCSSEFKFLKFSKISPEKKCVGAFLNIVTGLQVCNFIKKTPFQMLLCEITTF